MPERDIGERNEFLRLFPVSRETLEKLDRYAALLREWNAKFNLVAESTLPQIWTRHFLDSAQLVKFIPTAARTLADLGSGAGFPGIVLGIMGVPGVHLIESIGKKADFLRLATAELGVDAVARQARAESIRDLRFDIITARALKPLPDLLKLSRPLMKKESFCLFLKGQKAEAELTESGKYWRFDSETFPSLSDPSGRIIKIGNLEYRRPGKKRRGSNT